MANEALTLQLLQWIGDNPRSYMETMEAWRTSCPRMTIWEDALGDGLIERVAGATLSQAKVRVTESGRAYMKKANVGRADELRVV